MIYGTERLSSSKNTFCESYVVSYPETTTTSEKSRVFWLLMLLSLKFPFHVWSRLENQLSDLTKLADNFGLLDDVKSKWETSLRPELRNQRNQRNPRNQRNRMKRLLNRIYVCPKSTGWIVSSSAMPLCQALRCIQCRAFDHGRDHFLADCGVGRVLFHGRPIFPPLRSQETVRSFPTLVPCGHETG